MFRCNGRQRDSARFSHILVIDEQGRCCGIVAQADVVQSNASPIRTNKVIREISESAPSRNLRIPMRERNNRPNYQSHSNRPSLMSSGSLLPLLIGLGSGVALTYLLSAQRNADRRQYISNLNIDAYEHENRQDVTNQESFGKYVDAEQEIEQRQQHLEDRVQALRSEPTSPLINNVESSDREEEITVVKDKERSASKGLL